VLTRLSAINLALKMVIAPVQACKVHVVHVVTKTMACAQPYLQLVVMLVKEIMIVTRIPSVISATRVFVLPKELAIKIAGLIQIVILAVKTVSMDSVILTIVMGHNVINLPSTVLIMHIVRSVFVQTKITLVVESQNYVAQNAVRTMIVQETTSLVVHFV